MKSIVHFSSSISTVILWIALTSNCFIQAQLQNEKNAATTSENTLITGPAHNNAEIQFMDLKKDEFLPLADNVTATIAKYLTEYCQSKSDCGTSKRFTENDIGFYGKTLKDKLVENGRFVIAKIYAKTESSSHITGATILGQPEISEDSLNVLPKQTMEDFMINYRDQIVEETKIPIAYVNNKNVYPQRDNLDNYLIVSISCTFCVILIIFNLICQRRMSHQIKQAFLKNSAGASSTIYKKEGEVKGEKAPLNNKDKFANKGTFKNTNEYQLTGQDGSDNDDHNGQELVGKASKASGSAGAGAARAVTSRRPHSVPEHQHQQINQRDHSPNPRHLSTPVKRAARPMNDYDEDVELEERFPIPERTPMLYTTTTSSQNNDNNGRTTLDINTRIRLTQV